LGKFGLESDDGSQRFEATVNFYDVAQDSDFAELATGGDPALDIKAIAQPGNINVKDPGTENRTLNLNYNNKAVFGSTALDAQLYTGELTTTFSKFPGFSQTEIASDKSGLRVTFDTPAGGANSPVSVIWGIDYLADETTQTALDGPQDSPVLDQDALAYFAQLEISAGDRAEISVGLRQEEIDVDASDFSRDEGVTTVQGGTLTFSETLSNISGTVYLSDNWDIYGGYSEGFTLGDIGRSISDGTFATAREFESEAQTTENIELGIRAEYNSWNASLTFFTSDSDNGSSFDEDLNILKQPEEIEGAELALDFSARANLSFGGTVTVIEGETDTNNDGNFDEDLPTTRIPPTKVTLYMEHAPSENWLYRLQGTYSGSREPTSSAFGGTSDIESYYLLDLFAKTSIGPGDLSIGIENLLNEDYTPVINQAYDLDFAYIRGPGASLTVNYRWQF